ncbi:phage holin family protein [Schaalia sp. lx-260]|uniref:phage holin family protein n=1 Tax=Schaalia sp. lx-260 TaxID=2899082 RepID=UPI001E5EF8AD|nr:phage holin family protein [Schaalia sp. lx-260]MCD4548889.1 phage holin family protein [Schaalia sp. lx-260]
MSTGVFDEAQQPSPALTSDAPEQPESVGTLFTSLITHFRTLIEDEIRLAKMKIFGSIRSFAVAVGLLVVAAVCALYLLGWMLHSIELAFALLLPAWAASLVVCGVLLLLVVILLWVAVALFKKGHASSSQASQDIQGNIAADIDVLKKGMGK